MKNEKKLFKIGDYIVCGLVYGQIKNHYSETLLQAKMILEDGLIDYVTISKKTGKIDSWSSCYQEFFVEKITKEEYLKKRLHQGGAI